MIGKNRRTSGQPLTREQPASIVTGSDQKQRWTYEVTLLRDPGPIIFFWKIAIPLAFIISIVFFGTRLHTGFGTAARASLTLLFYSVIGVTLLAIFLCLLLGFLKTGRRNILFELDQLGIQAITMHDTVSAAEVKSYLSVLAGRMKGDPAAMSAAPLSYVRSTRYFVFSDVRRIRLRPGRHHLELRGKRKKMLVYFSRDQFEYILAWIMRAAPQAELI